MNTESLLTKPQAAKLLGVSVSTFDRIRKRLGLEPTETPLIKPVYFDRDRVQALRNAKPEPAPAPAVPTRFGDGILSVPQIKQRAKKGNKI